MKARVVYESHWGNTEAIARAIADGIGPEARAVHTDEAAATDIVDADLVVAGAPVLGFSLPSERMIEGLPRQSGAPRPADVSHPSLRSWLETLPRGHGRSAAFETGIRWSPGGAKGTIDQSLETAGYAPLAKPQRFVVKGQYGPLHDGELERARAWGVELAKGMTSPGADR